MTGTIQCAEHGDQQMTFVCEHLIRGKGLGFNFFPEPDNSRPDAWCNDCEIIRESVNGWDEESEGVAKISLLCGACYDRAKMLNSPK
jgi:hypothetical protein